MEKSPQGCLAPREEGLATEQTALRAKAGASQGVAGGLQGSPVPDTDGTRRPPGSWLRLSFRDLKSGYLGSRGLEEGIHRHPHTEKPSSRRRVPSQSHLRAPNSHLFSH